jgi:hypothetical protein
VPLRIKRKNALKINAPYSVCTGKLGGKGVVIAGSESAGGALNIYTGEEFSKSGVVRGPGGTVSMVFDEWNGLPVLFTGEGLYPVFVSKDAGVSVYTAENGVSGSWKRQRIADLAFIHRVALVRACRRRTVIAATLCGKKESIDDWSSPGAVYAVQILNEGPPFQVETVKILDGIRKNHGMFVRRSEGGETVYISGEEGIFTITVPRSSEDWITEKILDEPVSELAVFDLDGDGKVEIAAIQPFHGDRVCILKSMNEKWLPVYETKTELGHGIWAGKIGGRNGFVLGSRAGRRTFSLYTLEDRGSWKMRRTVIEEGTGTAQFDVLHFGNHDAIVATNNYINEVTVYEVTA